jgi:hypothetical protein
MLTMQDNWNNMSKKSSKVYELCQQVDIFKNIYLFDKYV